MILESALAELSIDLDQEMRVMPAYADRVVLEMGSPSESLSDQKSSMEKDPQSLVEIDISPQERQLCGDSYRTPGSVPFRWEIEPGVPKSEIVEITESPQPSPPLRLPPSAYTASSSSTPSPKRMRIWKTRGYNFNRNSPASAHRHRLSDGHLQAENVYDRVYDDDDNLSNFELDSSDECSPVSILEHPGSPRSSPNSPLQDSPSESPVQCRLARLKLSPSNFSPLCMSSRLVKSTNLAEEYEYSDVRDINTASMDCQLGTAASSPARSSNVSGAFPCISKYCFFIPSLKHKEKTKQSLWAKRSAEPDKILRNENMLQSGSSCDFILDTHRAFPVSSALKKKKSLSRNKNLGTSAVTKQVRFSVEDTADLGPSSSNINKDGEATLAANELDWASYGLF